MDITVGITVICVIYGVLFFFDLFFKSCAHYPYIKLLEGLGLQLGFLTIKWRTKAFNRLLIRWGNSRPSFLRLWFTLGTYASLALLPISLLLFLFSVCQMFFVGSNIDSEPVIGALIPGVTLPFSELGYYGITLLLCSVVHELGHALAAVLEDVNLDEVGVSVFFVLPVAYVRMSTEKLFSLNKRKTLAILCAGIWHNIVITFAAFLIYCSLPYLFSPLYYTGQGVSVSQMSPESPLIGSRGLFLGDTIIKINDCDVYDENSWYDCLKEVKHHRPAFCVNSDLVHNLDESIPPKQSPDSGRIECCDAKYSSNLCFEYLDISKAGILEMPNHVCLPARIVAEKSTIFCTHQPHACPENTYCFRPNLNNDTNMFKIVCDNKDVLYLGDAGDLYYSIEVSSYISKNILSTTSAPDILTKLLKYIIIISLGLGIVNVLPIMFMDGQHIINVVAHLLFSKKYELSSLKVMTSTITIVFTILLFIYLSHHIYKKVF